MRRRSTQVALLKWVGGKRRLASALADLAPKLEGGKRYWEPFMGAASLFFRLAPAAATLSDTNPALISFFRDLRSDRAALIRALGYLRRLTLSEEVYLKLRRQFNRMGPGADRSALFLLLSHSCFNAIWRVNRRGEFNVPFSGRRRPHLPSARTLHQAALTLQRAQIRKGDFQAILEKCRPGDFVYMDPPYPPVNDTAFFTHYTQKRFTWVDQERLACEVRRLSALGCRVLVSNADSPRIRQLYRSFRIERLPVTRYVAAGGIRHRLNDVAILNFATNGELLRTITVKSRAGVRTAVGTAG